MTTILPFTKAHESTLVQFLSSSQRPKGTFSFSQLAGFLFSMANAPEMILPSEWMPIIFNDQDGQYESKDEAERVLQAMMALFNDCGRERANDEVSLPPGCEIRPQPLDNLDADAPLSQWARGFIIGHSYLEEIWDDCIPESLDDEVGGILMALSFFATPNLAETYHKEAREPGSLEHLAQSVITIFPDAISEYALLGRTIFQALREEEGFEQPPSGRSKIGRNDPCPCGSGKKYKRCCGAN